MGLFGRITKVFRKKDQATKIPEVQPENQTYNGLMPDSNSDIKPNPAIDSADKIKEIPEVFTCRTCGKTFASENERDNHHKSQYGFSESDSNQEQKPEISHTSSKDLNSDSHTEHQNGYFCEACGKKFDTELELEYHLKTQPEIHEAYDDKWDMMVSAETEKEKMLREQQDAIRKLNEIKIPVSKNCCICGVMDFPPFEGRDGKYYCRDHILPENRRTGEIGKPQLDNPGSVVHRADGIREFRH
jgi:hypothetical protein